MKKLTNLFKKALVWSLLLVTLFSLAPAAVLLAQREESEWSAPILLFEENGSIFDPTIVADQSGGLHVFWRFRSADIRYDLLFYTKLQGAHWVFPIDVMASGSINAPSAAADPDGQLHLAWQDTMNELYYSRATIDNEISAHDWQEPSMLATGNIHSQLVSDQDGNLNFVYTDPDGNGVFYRQLRKGDSSWSLPARVAPVSDNNATGNFARLAVGDDGTIHVVWTEFRAPMGWPPIGTYYTRSVDGGQSWDRITKIADEGNNQIGVAAGPDGTVHVVWNGMAGVHGRYHRWSADNGRTWSDTELLDTAGVDGSTGVPAMVVDSAGALHVLVTDAGCLLYLTWQSNTWSPATCISQKAIGASNFIEEPDMAISEGNKLHVVFWDNRERLWYMTKETAAPGKSPLPFPTLQPTVTVRPSPTPEATATPHDFSADANFETSPEVINPALPIFWGILPSIAVLGVAIAAITAINKKR